MQEKQKGHVYYKQSSYFGPFERERALDENFSILFLFSMLIYSVRQIRY
jgi:hypothetical protein